PPARASRHCSKPCGSNWSGPARRRATALTPLSPQPKSTWAVRRSPRTERGRVNRRAGVLGGTFDPIHCGHLDVGTGAQTALALDEILIIPANVPPHRETPIASGYHRFAMVALAIAGWKGWRALDLEMQNLAPSYTSTSLRRLHADGLSP